MRSTAKSRSIARSADLEKLYTFTRFFETKLPQDPLQLDGDVAIEYYRLDKLSEGAIVLRVAEPGVVYGASEVGTKKAKEDEAQLSEIIEVLNERFGTEFNQAEQILAKLVVRREGEELWIVDGLTALPTCDSRLSVVLAAMGCALEAERVSPSARPRDGELGRVTHVSARTGDSSCGKQARLFLSHRLLVCGALPRSQCNHLQHGCAVASWQERAFEPSVLPAEARQAPIERAGPCGAPRRARSGTPSGGGG